MTLGPWPGFDERIPTIDNRTPLYVLLGVAAAFVVALALFGSGTESGAASTTSTFADIDIPDPPQTTTTRPRAVEATPDVRVIALDEPIVLGLERLVIVVGQTPTGHRLLVADHGEGEVAEFDLFGRAADFQLDASGTAVAFFSEGGLRIVTVDGDPIATPDRVAQFAWSGDEPLTAVWFDDGPEDFVFLGRVEDGALVVADRIGVATETDETLQGVTSAGWWVTHVDPAAPRTTVVGFRPRDEAPGAWEAAADIVAPPRSGLRALLARLDVSSWSWNFVIGAGEQRPLEGAPGDASGDYGFAALSPTGVQVAFIGNDDRGLGWLEIHSTVGGTARRLLLPYRVWDVRWSQRGDYVIMPGTDNRGSHVVVISDTRVTSTQLPWVYAVEVDDWVQFATLVDTPRHTTSDGGPSGN